MYYLSTTASIAGAITAVVGEYQYVLPLAMLAVLSALLTNQKELTQ